MGFSVYLQSGKTRKKITEVDSNTTIQTVIDKLKEQIKSNKLILCIFESKPLEPGKTLGFYGIKRHNVIQYTDKYKGGNYFK